MFSMNQRFFHRTLGATLGLGIASGFSDARAYEDWPQFRGLNASSVSNDSKLPVEFGGESKSNIAWQTKLPGRSVGGAIVVGDQVITTSSSGMDQRRLHLISLNQQDGSIRWQQELVARGRPFCHPLLRHLLPTERMSTRFTAPTILLVSIWKEIWFGTDPCRPTSPKREMTLV